MTAAAERAIENLAERIPLWGKGQTTAYIFAMSQIAVGIMSALYVLITQASYWGHSLKASWDSLNVLWHFHAIPLIGNWMFTYYDLGRHIYWRDEPEAIVGYALVAMIVVKLAPMKDTPPLVDRVLVRLRMPSRYQGRLGRHPDTSVWQYLLLLPSMLLASLPGTIIGSVLVFGGIGLAHKAGLSYGWLATDANWVPIAIGIFGGAFFGHKPAVKAGDDIQDYFLRKRLAIAYRAEDILEEFHADALTLGSARDQLTKMRGTRPSILYPISYQLKYDTLLRNRAAIGKYSRASGLAITGLVVILAVLAIYGLYIRKWGVTHGFWMP